MNSNVYVKGKFRLYIQYMCTDNTVVQMAVYSPDTITVQMLSLRQHSINCIITPNNTTTRDFVLIQIYYKYLHSHRCRNFRIIVRGKKAMSGFCRIIYSRVRSNTWIPLYICVNVCLNTDTCVSTHNAGGTRHYFPGFPVPHYQSKSDPTVQMNFQVKRILQCFFQSNYEHKSFQMRFRELKTHLNRNQQAVASLTVY